MQLRSGEVRPSISDAGLHHARAQEAIQLPTKGVAIHGDDAALSWHSCPIAEVHPVRPLFRGNTGGFKLRSHDRGFKVIYILALRQQAGTQA
jgi:hypothetical protein